MSIITGLVGWFLVGTGVVGLVTPIVPGTILIATGLLILVGRRRFKKLKYKFLPWLKKKHAEYKKRKATAAKR